jgi:hypothetical protein
MNPQAFSFSDSKPPEMFHAPAIGHVHFWVSRRRRVALDNHHPDATGLQLNGGRQPYRSRPRN